MQLRTTSSTFWVWTTSQAGQRNLACIPKLSSTLFGARGYSFRRLRTYRWMKHAGLQVVCKAQPSVGANARAGASPALGLGERARSPRALKRTQARARARTTCNTNEHHIASAPGTVIARDVAFWRESSTGLVAPRSPSTNGGKRPNPLQKWPGVLYINADIPTSRSMAKSRRDGA